MTTRIIAIAGVSSNSGKTTLLCELLHALSRSEVWEAIKLTRGHYRSCGKDPHACCVSPLLGAEPTVHSGREATYTSGKDTGRYWDAGAANVHWVVATDRQVEIGIRLALERVTAPNVLIEGTSLLEFLPVDFAILVTTPSVAKLKPSARRLLIRQKINALYLSEQIAGEAHKGQVIASLSQLSPEIDANWLSKLPFITAQELPDLLYQLGQSTK